MVAFLISRKCNIDITDHEGNTPLMKAIQYLQEECAHMLLERGAKPDVRNIRDETPLHLAVALRTPSLTEKLLSLNVDVEVRNESGHTPLLLAIKHNKVQAVETLIQWKANIHAVDRKGRTALMLALAHESKHLAELLLQGGIDVSATDDVGQMALAYAIDSGHRGHKELIIRHMNEHCKSSGYTNPDMGSVSSLKGDKENLMLDKQADAEKEDSPVSQLGSQDAHAPKKKVKLLDRMKGLLPKRGKLKKEARTLVSDKRPQCSHKCSKRNLILDKPKDKEREDSSVSLMDMGPQSSHKAEETNLILDKPEDREREDSSLSHMDMGPQSSYKAEETNLILDKPEDREREDSSLSHMDMDPQSSHRTEETNLILEKPEDREREDSSVSHMDVGPQSSPKAEETNFVLDKPENGERDDSPVLHTYSVIQSKRLNADSSFHVTPTFKNIHCSQCLPLVKKLAKVEKELDELKREHSRAKTVISNMTQENVALKLDFHNMRWALKKEQMRNDCLLFERNKDQFKEKENEYNKEVKKKLETSVTKFDTALNTTRNTFNQGPTSEMTEKQSSTLAMNSFRKEKVSEPQSKITLLRKQLEDLRTKDEHQNKIILINIQSLLHDITNRFQTQVQRCELLVNNRNRKLHNENWQYENKSRKRKFESLAIEDSASRFTKKSRQHVLRVELTDEMTEL